MSGQLEQTELQRTKLQKELTEKQTLLAHTTAAIAPLEQKQAAQDFSSVDSEIQKLSEQYDAVQDDSADKARSELRGQLNAIRSRQYSSVNAVSSSAPSTET